MAKTKKVDNWREAGFEAVLELSRVALLAAVPLMVTSLEAGETVEWRIIAVAVSIAVLRSIDRFVHEWNQTEANGVVPF